MNQPTPLPCCDFFHLLYFSFELQTMKPWELQLQWFAHVTNCSTWFVELKNNFFVHLYSNSTPLLWLSIVNHKGKLYVRVIEIHTEQKYTRVSEFFTTIHMSSKYTRYISVYYLITYVFTRCNNTGCTCMSKYMEWKKDHVSCIV